MSKIIRSTDENALEELKEKLAQMESAHKEMVARNKHYFKNGTMKGYGDFTDDRAAKMDLAIQGTYEKKPYASYQLQNSNQEIRRIKMRIKALEYEQNRETETYDTEKYEQLHLLGHKRVWPYRFDAQERALMGGMRGVAFSALLGLSDFRKDALASALHVYYLQKKYPHAEMSLSCPRLRPIINNEKINPLDVHERELCQIICAYRIFLPFVGITVSSRESASFRNGIIKIAATKVSAGVSTGIGDHESKYTGKKEDNIQGDEQFEIDDNRSLDVMYKDIADEGLQPVLNDYLYV